MLKKPTIAEAETCMDFAYALALDPSRSGYPTYTDGIKTKEDFLECCRYGLTNPNREVLLYLENGQISGWIQAIVEPESEYVEANIFNIAGDYAAALEEFITYCAACYPGYRICMGFPGENRTAIEALTARGWHCEERSYNNVLFFDQYALLPEDDGVTPVTCDNYPIFRTLHESVQGDMYWNADRILDKLDQWKIWTLESHGQADAAIYVRDSGCLMEIYGVDYRDGQYQKEAFSSLVVTALNACKRSGKKHMVFFGDDETQTEILKLGFRCVGEYLMFAGTAGDRN